MEAPDELHIGHSAIRTGMDLIRERVKRISEIVRLFEEDMNGVAQKWTGDSAAAWQQHQAAINKEVGDMNSVLANTGTQLGETSQAFAKADRNTADWFLRG